MKKTTTSLALATFLAAVIGCAAAGGPASLRGAGVSAPDRAPALKAYTAKLPGVGQKNLIARTFINQPPLVPHTVEQYALTLDENACLDCHLTKELRGQPVPQMSESHFVKGQAKPTVAMDKFQCDSCHVAQVDAKPLVDNKFVGVK